MAKTEGENTEEKYDPIIDLMTQARETGETMGKMKACLESSTTLLNEVAEVAALVTDQAERIAVKNKLIQIAVKIRAGR